MDLFDGIMQGGNHPPQLVWPGAIGRHEDHDIADGSREDAAPGHGFADADARAGREGDGSPALPVLNEFDAGDETDLTDVADGRTLPECGQSFGQLPRQGFPGALGSGGPEECEAFAGNRAAEGVAGVAVAVEEGAELRVLAEKGVEDGLRGKVAASGR